MSESSDDKYYDLVCKTCNRDMRCKQKWKTICSDCYKLTNHADKYHRCGTCNKVVKKYKDFTSCYDCFIERKNIFFKKNYEFNDSDTD